jgi:hypothetical protein
MKERNGYKEKKERKLVTWTGCLLGTTETIFIKTWKYPASDAIQSYCLEAFTAAHRLFQKPSTR